MFKQRHRISILMILALMIIVIAVPVSAMQSDSRFMPTTLQNNTDSVSPLYYGEHEWHHRYTRHGHSHDGLRHHEREQHRHCRYFEHDGLYHFPINHR